MDWRTRGLRALASPIGTVSAGLARTDVAVREWVGLVTYRLTGRMSELFPGPRVTQSAAAARAGRRP